MRTIRAIALTAALLAPSAHAQGGDPLQTSFNDALAILCENHGALELAGMRIEIPGARDLGLDLRPICQYADIVSKGTDMLQGVRNGALRSTEAFINDAIATVVASFGGRVETERANEAIEQLGEDLRAAMEAGPEALAAYRAALNEGLSTLAEEAVAKAEADFAAAVQTAANSEPGTTTEDERKQATVPYFETQRTAAEAAAATAAQRLELDVLTEASAEGIAQQAANNAHQQAAEDTLRLPTAPGDQGGLAHQAVQDAKQATSVRQSINVLTEALANQMRNDAIFSGAVIENLQANARQQAITNHQLQMLAANVIAEQERELMEQVNAIDAELSTMQREAETSYQSMLENLKEASRVTSTEPMEQINFSYCGLFGGC